MGKFSAAFAKAKDAKPAGNRTPQIGLGKHRVGIKFFRGKVSDKDRSLRFEAEFVVLQSQTEPVGATRWWAWYTSQPGFAGQFAEARMIEFATAVGQSISSDQETHEILDAIVLDEEAGVNQSHGIVLDVLVEIVPDKTDPRRAMKTSKGQDIHNATWIPVPQGEEEIEAAKVEMAKLSDAYANSQAQEAQPKAAQQTATTATAAVTSSAGAVDGAVTKTAGIKRLLGAK